MHIEELNTPEKIAKSFPAFLELRPSLTDEQTFVKQVLEQQKEGYRVHAIIEDNVIVACMGFRIMRTLIWGKFLYIDDFTTKEEYRHQGYGKILLTHAEQVARENGCEQIHLDSGFTRYDAHKLYLSHGLKVHCLHFALDVK